MASKAVKFTIWFIVIAGLIAGGAYYYLNYRLKKSVEDLNAFVSANLPGCEVTYGDLSTNIISGAIKFTAFDLLCPQGQIITSQSITFSGIHSDNVDQIKLKLEADDFNIYLTRLLANDRAGVLADAVPTPKRLIKKFTDQAFQEDITLDYLKTNVELDNRTHQYALLDFDATSKNVKSLDAVKAAKTISFDAFRFNYVSTPPNLKGAVNLGALSIYDVNNLEPKEFTDTNFEYYVADNASRFGLLNFTVTHHEKSQPVEQIIAFNLFEIKSDLNYLDYLSELMGAKGALSPLPSEFEMNVKGYSFTGFSDLTKKVLKRSKFYPLKVDFSNTYKRKKEDQTAHVNLNLLLQKFGKINLSAIIGNLPELTLAPQKMQEQFIENPPTIHEAEITLIDQPGRDAVFDALVAEGRPDPAMLLPIYIALFQSSFSGVEDQGVKDMVQGAARFIANGGKLRVKLSPPQPISVIDLSQIGKLPKKEAADIMGLELEYTKEQLN